MSLESLPMRKEPVFDAGGTYELVIKINLCLHQEAVAKVFEVVTDHLTKTKASKTLKILDLACGGKPLIPATIMERLPNYQFAYTGVDLNKDQIDACKKYSFPKNAKANVIEGNVWELSELTLTPPYDIVFMGLNSHHAVPEEILYAVRAIYKILKPNGLFLNHDLFRPSKYPYLRRPESIRFILKEKLEKAGISTPLLSSLAGIRPSSWREKLFSNHKAFMLSSGADEKAVNETIEHMRERDWPVSLEEMGEILKQAGFKTDIHRYQNTHYPMPEFFGLIVGKKST